MQFTALARLTIALSLTILAGCEASNIDVSKNSPYKEHIGQVCEVLAPLSAHGYTLKVEREQKTDGVIIYEKPMAVGSAVTFVVSIDPGVKLTFVEAQECSNCPFDRNPKYRVLVTPEPPQFKNQAVHMQVSSLRPEILRCVGGPSAA